MNGSQHLCMELYLFHAWLCVGRGVAAWDWEASKKFYLVIYKGLTESVGICFDFGTGGAVRVGISVGISVDTQT